MTCRSLLLLALAFLAAGGVSVEASDGRSVSIAAAANFVYALDALNTEFKRVNSGVTLVSTTGSSGSLYAQIKHGAPFDLFLSADTDYPRQIVESKLGDASSLRVFATGRMAVWTTRLDADLTNLAAVIRSPLVRKVAIAQPRSAPYGRAAQAALEHIGVWREVEPNLVFGENVSQTAQFVETGNAEIGFVAVSIVRSPKLEHTGHWREIAPDLYEAVSLDHAGVLTTRGAANPAAKRYLDFLGSEHAKKILRDYGYAVP